MVSSHDSALRDIQSLSDLGLMQRVTALRWEQSLDAWLPVAYHETIFTVPAKWSSAHERTWAIGEKERRPSRSESVG